MTFRQDQHRALSAKGGKRSQAKRFSLTRAVAAEVEARHRTTLDNLEAAFPEHTRARVKSALYNARYAGLVQVVEPPTSLGTTAAVWGPKRDGEPERTDPTTLPRPVSSIFELGDRARAEHFDRRSQALHRASF
jgi:hypothetical protein